MATASRMTAVRAGVRIEAITVAWMVLEAIVAIGAGIAARSVLLTAFGFDSVVELISGGLLLWRLSVEARGTSSARVERVEKRALVISAGLLVLLSIYVLVTSGIGLLTRAEPEGSIVGIGVSIAAVIVMPLLARSKRKVNLEIDSAALRADIAETITCAYMAGSVLIGVGLNVVLHWWWAEYLAAFALLIWLVPETREAIEAAKSGTDGHYPAG